jgi:cold-inducible RNA-binding protein
MKKLYVGNLPYNTSDEELRTIFVNGGFECDDVTIISDRDTGRSRGFAFVTLANDADVEEAIAQINGFDIGGRNLRVNEAREHRERQGGGRGGGGDRY